MAFTAGGQPRGPGEHPKGRQDALSKLAYRPEDAMNLTRHTRRFLIVLALISGSLPNVVVGQSVVIRKGDLKKTAIPVGALQFRLEKLGPTGIYRYRKIKLELQNTSSEFQNFSPRNLVLV